MAAYNIPIALIVFNRPDCAKKTIERIRKVQPSRLFIIADGPRRHKSGEDELCRRTRETVESAIDWPCKVTKEYADKNMGCGKRLPSGLNRVFDEEEKAIILEDDVLPDLSFFPFCEAMLKQYESVEQIMQIGAYNRFQYAPANNLTYFYSRFSDIWGWATWRRAWKKFQALDATSWQTIRDSEQFANACYSAREAEMRKFCMDEIFSEQLSAWGMRWDTTKLLNNGLGIVPSKNLAQNIGFGVEASHTVNPLNLERFKKVHQVKAPYISPDQICSDPGFDERYNKKMFPNNVFTEKFRTGILKLFGKK